MNALMCALALVAVQEWDEPAGAEHVKKLTDDISLLNLIRGLYLTREQSERIIALAKEAGELRDSAYRKDAELLREYEDALRILREKLIDCGAVPAEVEQRAQAAEHKVHEARKAYLGRLQALEKKLCGVLTKAQLCVIDPYQPCLIPPKDLKDPVRVGQASTETADIEDQLESLRSMPDRAWKPVGEALFTIWIGFMESVLGPLGEKELPRLLRIAERAREMTDDEFALEKESLARQVIRPVLEHQDKTNELTQHFYKITGGLGKTGKILLNPRIVPILEARLKHVCEKPERPDVEAESCKKCGGGGKLVIENIGPEPKYAVFAAWLEISDDKTEELRRAIARGQRDLLITLSGEREDGRNILREFLQCLLHQKEKEAFELFTVQAPNGKTYWKCLEEIAGRMDAELRVALTEAQYTKMKSASVDLFKVKVGSLRWTE